MLFNFDWLKQGEKFPPLSEIQRLKNYKDNAALFEDNTHDVLKPYQDRLFQIIGQLKNTDTLGTTFYNTPAFWQLSTIKTVDLMVGDKPTIICDKIDSGKISEVLQNSEFESKLDDLVEDNDALGECLIRPYVDSKGNRNFVAQSPLMWFPVVNPENIKEVTADTLAWTVCVYQDANHPEKNKYELYVKIQVRGEYKYTFKRFKISSWEHIKNYTDKRTFEEFGPQTLYCIGSLLEEKEESNEFDQLVIHIPGITTSRSNHGISSYDRITPLVAELGVRESLGNFILDENAAPRMAAPDSAFVKNKDGKWELKTGGRNFVVAPGAATPIYVTWDGNTQANETRIAEIKNTLYSMCEMGSVINNDNINSSQGYEALEVKLTNPKAKVRRMAGKFKAPLKKLIAYLLNEPKIEAYDINIIFNEGIPTSEGQNNALAQQKKNIGFSFKSIAMEFYGLTEEQAEEEWGKAKEENADSFIEQFGGSRNSLFGGGNDGDKGNTGDVSNKGKQEPKEKENGGNKPNTNDDGDNK